MGITTLTISFGKKGANGYKEKIFKIGKGFGGIDDCSCGTLSKITGPAGYQVLEAKSEKEFNFLAKFMKEADTNRDGVVDGKDFSEEAKGTVFESDALASFVAHNKDDKNKCYSIFFQ